MCKFSHVLLLNLGAERHNPNRSAGKHDGEEEPNREDHCLIGRLPTAIPVRKVHKHEQLDKNLQYGTEQNPYRQRRRCEHVVKHQPERDDRQHQ